MQINFRIIQGAEYEMVCNDYSVPKYILCVYNFPRILHNMLCQYIDTNELKGRFKTSDVKRRHYVPLGYRVVSYKIYFTITAENSQQLSNFLSNEIIKYRHDRKLYHNIDNQKYWRLYYNIDNPKYQLNHQLHNRIRNN